jgi:3-methylcrotonyl-CoA carboxylase alpha subunit
VEKSGLNFIGPPSRAIKSMGSKRQHTSLFNFYFLILFSESKTIMTIAGVPCIPGYHGNNQDPEFLSRKAEEIGYPIMIKAVLGGGGKVL